MSAYDLAYIAGFLIAIVLGTVLFRGMFRRPQSQQPDPQCAHLDVDGHRCVLMTGHTADHEVLAIYKRPSSRV